MNISKFSILFIFLSTILSCTSTNSDVSTDSESASSLQVVDCQYFQERMQSDEPYLLLDVRTQEEVDQGMIKGAEHMDFYAADFTQSLEKLDKEQPVLVYCARGGRSNKAANQMIELGFKEVYDLSGGYTAWTSCQ